MQRDLLCKCQKRPITVQKGPVAQVSKETYCSTKEIYYSAKEIYYSVQEACQESLLGISETQFCAQTLLPKRPIRKCQKRRIIVQKRPIAQVSKETYYSAKETYCASVKRDLL